MLEKPQPGCHVEGRLQGTRVKRGVWLDVIVGCRRWRQYLEQSIGEGWGWGEKCSDSEDQLKGEQTSSLQASGGGERKAPELLSNSWRNGVVISWTRKIT